MNFDLEYELQKFREEQPELFENGKRYTGVSLSNATAEKMLLIINGLEAMLDKDKIITILSDASEPYGEDYEKRHIYDNDFEEVAKCISL